MHDALVRARLAGNGLRVDDPTLPPRRLPGPMMDGKPQHHIRKRYAVTVDLALKVPHSS
jgi:hypothetical protein